MYSSFGEMFFCKTLIQRKRRIMYKVFEEHLFTEENEGYITYGIVCLENNNTIHDISLNKTKIEEFVELLNKNELHYIHLADVVEDCLNDLI